MKRAAAYQDVLDHLAPLATGSAVLNNQTVTVFQASYLVPPLDGGANPLDTYALWPAGTIGLSSGPQTLQIARNTILRDDSWGQDNAFPQVRQFSPPYIIAPHAHTFLLWGSALLVQIFAAAVRAGFDMPTLMKNWHLVLTTWCRTNLYCSVANAGVEGLGAVGAVNEMLLQVTLLLVFL